MRVAQVRRPLCCLKTALTAQKSCQLRPFRRCLSTPAEPPLPSSNLPRDYNFLRITDPKTKRTRTAFAVYPSSGPTPPETPSTAATAPAEPTATTTTIPLRDRYITKSPPLLTPAPKRVLSAFDAWQIRLMDPTGLRTQLFARSNRQAAKPGDVLLVTQRRGGEPFAGVLLAIRRSGIDTAILLRGQLTRIGVEQWIKVYSSRVASIEIVHRRPKRARRARLTYMRKPEHDMGSVDHLVSAWLRARRTMSARFGGGKKAAAQGKGKEKDKGKGKAGST